MQNNFYSGRYDRLVIHTPHAGIITPIQFHQRPESVVFGFRILPLLYVLTDHYIDKLFAADASFYAKKGKRYTKVLDHRIVQISFPISRLFCDVERIKNDPLEKKGLGIHYDLSRHAKGCPCSLTKDQIMSMYDNHQLQLSHALWYGGLLLDCHSFSEQDNILCPNAHEYKEIDICLGFNEDETKPSQVTIDRVADFFREREYTVAINSPFSNSKTVDARKPYHSLMIEVNKHCYMNEDTLEVTAGFYKLHAELQELYKLLLNN